MTLGDKMAAAPLLLRAAAPRIVPNARRVSGTFKYTLFAEDHANRTEYEVHKDPPEWKHVENLHFPKIVPKPIPKAEHPSGWRPQDPDCASGTYYVARTGNHMLPLYLDASHGGERKITKIAKVEGDINGLKDEIESHLRRKRRRIVVARAHEVCGKIEIKGDHFLDVRDFLYSKGF